MTRDEYRFVRYLNARLQDKVEGVQRAPNGNRLCRWCREETPSKRSTYCGKEKCVKEFSIRCGFFKYEVHDRDQGVCSVCGVKNKMGHYDIDHIIPVAEGGGCCGLSNLRTLCKICHKQLTRRLSKRLSMKRKKKRSLLRARS